MSSPSFRISLYVSILVGVGGCTVGQNVWECERAPCATLHIGTAEKDPDCKRPIVSVSSVDGDIDNAWERYRWGGIVRLKPGEHVISYVCMHPVESQGRCSYIVDFGRHPLRYHFSAQSYQLYCDDESKAHLVRTD